MGGGALLLVLAASTHDTYSDILPLFATRLSWLLRKVHQAQLFNVCTLRVHASSRCCASAVWVARA